MARPRGKGEPETTVSPMVEYSTVSALALFSRLLNVRAPFSYHTRPPLIHLTQEQVPLCNEVLKCIPSAADVGMRFSREFPERQLDIATRITCTKAKRGRGRMKFPPRSVRPPFRIFFDGRPFGAALTMEKHDAPPSGPRLFNSRDQGSDEPRPASYVGSVPRQFLAPEALSSAPGL
jgi:hypothetical protein